jgi:hypothetical protein
MNTVMDTVMNSNEHTVICMRRCLWNYFGDLADKHLLLLAHYCL